MTEMSAAMVVGLNDFAELVLQEVTGAVDGMPRCERMVVLEQVCKELLLSNLPTRTAYRLAQQVIKERMM
jgi:hypothetical protein